MADKSDVSSGGIGLAGVLFCIFLVLKLTGVINWSWWWVTAPLWGSFLIFLLIMFVGLIIFLIWGNVQ